MAERQNNGVDLTAAECEGAQHRKPYTSPTLRRLGSVRDLTLGSNTGSLSEANPKHPRKKGM